MTPLPAFAISCYSDLGIVRDVNPEHLANQTRAVMKRLAELGVLLDPWEIENLEFSLQKPEAPTSIGAIQQVLDAHVLISLSVSVEGEIKAAAGPALTFVPAGGSGTFLIKVDNIPRQSSPLLIESQNALEPSGQPTLERWMRFKIWPEGSMLSGERVDYFLLHVESTEKGRREALFAFSSGLRPMQQPGPLSYNRIPILFQILTEPEIVRAKLAHLLRHQHGAAYLAAQRRRGPPLMSIRSETCLGCHDTATTAQNDSPQFEREQSCIGCHRELAAAAVPSGRCPVCGMQPCRMGCLSGGKTKTGAKIMRMAGVPRPLFLGGVGAILAISFVGIEVLNRRGPRPTKRWRWNLLSLRFAAGCIRRGWLRPLCQIPIFLLFSFLIYAGLAGHKVVNLAPILTWTVWWAGLIFLVLFLGKAWCFVCPWDFAATLIQKAGVFWGSRKALTAGLRWPRALRNIYPAIGLFIVLTWLELGYQVTASPRATAVLALVMVGLALAPALIFEKRSFCRYACMIGRISGLYAMFAPVEVRRADPHLCRQCRTHDCYHGNQNAPPCPTSLLLPAVKENTYCIQCGHCARSCPSGNVAFNFRSFAGDLIQFSRPRADESILAIILLALTSFHGLTMTPFWDSPNGFSVIGWLRQSLGVGTLAAFTAGMAAMLAIPIVLYGLLCVVTRRLAGDSSVSLKKVFLYFAYSLLPVALFYHLAHNSMHFFMEAQYLLPLLSDPLGVGANYFGTAAWRPGPILSAQTIWWLQVGLVLVGHIFGLVIAHHASRKLYSDPRRARLSLLPMLGGMVLYSWFSLWILHLDMNMRSSLM